jgi:CCR4-NOT complex subunit CAF16
MRDASEPPLAAIASIVHGDQEDAVVIRSLNFTINFSAPLISDFSLTLPRGSRCLLCGANGAGKTTLLQVMAGKYMVGQDVVRILGRPAFHDIELVSSGDLSYLGPQWRRDLAISGSSAVLQVRFARLPGTRCVPSPVHPSFSSRSYACLHLRVAQGDISAGKMIFGIEGVDPARRARLISLLDIDLEWRLNRVSDGQRRRVQIALGLLKPYQVLLLDEITVDMDVVGRLDLLNFFIQECSERGATIVYATHIFDGMESWPTHLAYVEGGRMVRGEQQGQGQGLGGCRRCSDVAPQE